MNYDETFSPVVRMESLRTVALIWLLAMD